MKHTSKRLQALVLVLAMCVSFLQIPSFAANHTSAPYEVESVQIDKDGNLTIVKGCQDHKTKVDATCTETVTGKIVKNATTGNYEAVDAKGATLEGVTVTAKETKATCIKAGTIVYHVTVDGKDCGNSEAYETTPATGDHKYDPIDKTKNYTYEGLMKDPTFELVSDTANCNAIGKAVFAKKCSTEGCNAVSEKEVDRVTVDHTVGHQYIVDEKNKAVVYKEEITAPTCKENGGEGVGLFRTEFLYMESAELPTEEQQFEVYKEVLEGMEGKPVVVRTLDIGGDKEIEAIDLPKEMNPFLGVRAIRLCFQREDIFRTQLRALLRASVYGDLRIMFPMIATLQEFRKAKGILMEEKEKLIAEGVKVSDTLQVGIMIEIPAAAVLAHKFAKEVDFFSVGTNDLVQYTFAADRMSSGVSYLYQPFNPSILNLLKHVIDSAHAEGKWAGMCGEMAGEAIAAPLLLGLGLDEFSMSATSILAQRKLIKSVSKADMEALVEKALDCATSEEVIELVKSTVKM